MRRKPVVGETLYDLNVGNAARRVEQVLTPVKVTKVGRKYFTCAPLGNNRLETEFQVTDWVQNTNYCVDHKLYENPQQWYDEREVTRYLERLGNAFGPFGRPSLSLTQLRQIVEIIDTPQP